MLLGGYLIYDQMRFKSDDIILELNDVKVIEYGESFDPLTLIKKCSGEVIYQDVYKRQILYMSRYSDIHWEVQYGIIQVTS